MTKQHIDRLKELMLKSADLTEPIDYFLQHVITDAEIVRASQPATSARVRLLWNKGNDVQGTSWRRGFCEEDGGGAGRVLGG